MKIGNNDAARYGAKQLTVEFTLPQDGARNEWPDGFLTPVTVPTTQKMGSIKITFLFRGAGRDEIVRAISSFCGLLEGPQKLELDGYAGWFIGWLKGSKISKTASKSRYKLELELNGYRIDEGVQQTVTKGMPVLRKGSRNTLCTLTVIPKRTMERLDIFGFGDAAITIRNLHEGVPVVICDDGLVTENGANKMQDVLMLKFPALEKEETTLLWEPEDVLVKIAYTPAWL